MSSQVLKLKKNPEEDYNFEEAIKTLRTNLQFCGKSVRVVMFTSSLPDAGKSEISFCLSRSLAQIGKKTLLVDADIRKSELITRCETENDICGLSEYLSGQKAYRDIVYQTDEENMDMILAGPYSPNPAELLEEDLFEKLFQAARMSYDYVIVDTPPMAKVIDGAIAARQCDGAVIVVESGTVSYHLEQRTKEQLEKAGCRILGTVLNKMDIRSKGYYGKYGKYGKYGRYDEAYGEDRGKK